MKTKINATTLEHLSCTSLKGVGPRLAERLAKCGLYTVQDLLFHLPFRYQDRTRITPLTAIKTGDHVVVEGTIESIEMTHGRRPSLLCYLEENSCYLTLRFFYFTDKQRRSLIKGERLRCFGEVRGWGGELEMIHPEYQFVNKHTPALSEKVLTPVYPSTEGLNQHNLRSVTDQALALLGKHDALPDYLPEVLLQELHLRELAAALNYVHRPPVQAPVEQLLTGTHPAQQRLAFEELLAHHLSLRLLRKTIQCYQAPALAHGKIYSQRLLSSLPFQLTAAQQRVVNEIAQDLTQIQPMLRLLQGDVGSGKTIVAALSALQAVEQGYQVALMAPTDLLAEQHLQNFTNWFGSLGISVGLLTGRVKSKAREATLKAILVGDLQVIVGTHALFQADVNFAHLGLVIIDEQHRFGVHQRLALREKGVQQNHYPHQLIMTATPIPRTLAMTAYADLDVSIIDELPPGRTPIRTVVVSNLRREEIIERVRKVCKEGKQVYWVCPLIEESEAMQCQAAESTAIYLKEALEEFNVGLVHGRMSPQQKEAVMASFKQGSVHLLVATTVVEVGVDVPNASLMVIENAERLGLAQLHQLRGRVGRGSTASYCVLLYQHNRLSTQAKARLAIMRETNDGFAIARRDLELRGPGEVLGTRQAGLISLRIADLLRDHALLPRVQKAAEILLRDYPERVAPLIHRWIGQAKEYGGV